MESDPFDEHSVIHRNVMIIKFELVNVDGEATKVVPWFSS